MRISETIAAFLTGQLGLAATRPDEDLLEQAGLDSLQLIELVAFVEERFAIQIRPEDLVLDNFSSVARVARLIEDLRQRDARADRAQ